MRALNKFYFEIYDQDALLAINDFMKKFNVKNQALKHKNIQKNKVFWIMPVFLTENYQESMQKKSEKTRPIKYEKSLYRR
ncbi:hypothetical protein CAMRE0001_2868 [Campylobacter rectus RM3267]|uniref:Uncharacterized protein n=1 Tax=Campylobacter rectus RM3267 TaxID=553218 RepID=B9D4T2_CAMRE|nr:hypothetical protein CAMRE0001_2868 [Campylobacter rectus RM3267]